MNLEFDFLGAADGTPLTKTFRKDGNVVHTEPYPMVRDMCSYREHARDIRELHDLLLNHAAQNHCLLKGKLTRQIKGESRRDLTRSDDPTQWVCLDLDFESGWKDVDDFIAQLNPDWADCSYIFQHSSSAGIKYSPGLRGHVFILLEDTISPAILKLWLKQRNLELNGLNAQLELSANGLSLRWPLDTTTCQNDKLLYIAPPICEGVDDPLKGQRFVLVEKKYPFAPKPKLTKSPAAIDAETVNTIDKLRTAAGLPKRVAKYKDHGPLRLLTNPDSAVVTEVKRARGFVYVNLNGGDSWGYYFPERNPTILYNFKGEPPVRLQDLDPEFYEKYVGTLNEVRGIKATPYVFREPHQDIYYNALYDKDNDKMLLLATASSKQKLDDFMKQYGKHPVDPVEDWTVEFRPDRTDVIDPEKKWVNLFEPTVYIQSIGRLPKFPQVPPTIHKVIDSICGNDKQSYDRFINWLARLFQTRQRTNTAWVFHGVQGTGKGLLLTRVLRPLFGSRHVTEWTTQNFEDAFNGQLEHTLILWMDEFQASSAKDVNAIMNRLKNYITEDEITIRKMRSNAVQRQNWVNVIIATNHCDPIQLSEHDRRFNIPPSQEKPLLITEDEVDQISEELPAFAAFLANYEVDEEQVRRVMQNDARLQMVAATQTTTEQFFAAVRTGNFDWFFEFLRSDMPLNDTLYYQEFENVLVEWAKRFLEDGQVVHMSREELMKAYTYILGSSMSPAKFGRMCSIYRTPIKPLKYRGKTIRGIRVTMHTDKPETLRDLVKSVEDKAKLRLVGSEA